MSAASALSPAQGTAASGSVLYKVKETVMPEGHSMLAYKVIIREGMRAAAEQCRVSRQIYFFFGYLIDNPLFMTPEYDPEFVMN